MRYILCLTFLTTIPLFSQEYSRAIEDNSFLIEEAYNQEDRVVQHIITARKHLTGSNVEIAFSQEWPLNGQSHQFSFMIPYLQDRTQRGPGDIVLNYRYQLIRDNSLAISPRISILLPSGKKETGFGNGVLGGELYLPISKRISQDWVAHGNAGFQILPHMDTGGKKKTEVSFFIGGSVISLTTELLNILVEGLAIHSSTGTEIIINPGFRYAINIENIQIVPGVSLPVSFESNSSTASIFFYLSAEHPF